MRLGGRQRAELQLRYLEELELDTRRSARLAVFCRVEPLRVAVALVRPDARRAFLGEPPVNAGWDACAYPTARAMLAEARGDAEEAADGYREAAALWGEYGSILERGYALLGLGRCGDAAATREADAIFALLGARPVLAEAA